MARQATRGPPQLEHRLNEVDGLNRNRDATTPTGIFLWQWRDGLGAPVPTNSRLVSIMGESKRLGRWSVPQRLDVLAIMSDMRLDLTQAVLPPGIVDIDVRVVWAAFRIIVPPGMRVVNQIHSIMASVHSSTDDLSSVAGTGGGPIIRLTGLALMGEVKIVVRRREDPYGLDDDDD
jgi:hypothetical protein